MSRRALAQRMWRLRIPLKLNGLEAIVAFLRGNVWAIVHNFLTAAEAPKYEPKLRCCPTMTIASILRAVQLRNSVANWNYVSLPRLRAAKRYSRKNPSSQGS